MTSRKPKMFRILILFVVAMLAFAACTSDADDAPTPEPTEEETPTVDEMPEPADTPAGDEPLGDDTLVPPIRFLGATAAYEEALFESNNEMLVNWEALGLTIDRVLIGDVGELLDAAAPREYEVVSFGFGGRISRIDPDELISAPFRCDFAGPNGRNYSDYCNPEYDALIDVQRTATDPAERQAAVYALQELQALDMPWLTVYHSYEVYGYNSDAYGNVVPAYVVGASNFQNFVGAEPLTDDKIFRFGSDSVWRSINPMTVESYNQEVEIQKLVFDTLTKIQPDGTVGPHLGASWEFTDPTTLVVTLVDNATFTDGEPVTADDVKFSYDYFREWDVGLYVDPLSEIDSVDVIDDTTVQFNLALPSATILFTTLTNVMILPEHIWATVVEDEGLSHPSEWTETQLIGSGPYIVDNIVAAEAVELVRNDDFWGGPAASDGVLAIFFGDSQGLFRALQDGTIYFHQHGAMAPDARQLLTDGEVAGVTAGSIGSVETRGMALRMSEGSPFRDYFFRLALAHAVDKAFAVDVGNRGFADLGTGSISVANTFWHNPNIPTENGELGTPYWPQFDMDLARQILADAGYRWDDEGRMHYPSANYVPTKVLASD